MKQGDGISSQLYIMPVKLMHLRKEPLVQGITLPLDSTTKLVIVYTPLIEIYNPRYVVYKPYILLLLLLN